MTSKHTPGPWRCVTGGDGSFSILAGSLVLCQRNPWPHREVESHANGFLIEAAPDLLNNAMANVVVMKNLLAYLRKHEAELPPITLSSLEVRIEAAETWIAKACGGEG